LTRGWLSLTILVLMGDLMYAQEARPSTPELRASRDFLCSAEPRVTPIPELWPAGPGELHSELIIKADGEVGDARVVQSTFPTSTTEAAVKVLKTWQFEPATKNGYDGQSADERHNHILENFRSSSIRVSLSRGPARVHRPRNALTIIAGVSFIHSRFPRVPLAYLFGGSSSLA
jgi:TonB family protein